MEHTFWIIVAAAVGAIGAGWLLSIWLRQRGERAIVCPENRRPAGVRMDARRAALSGFAGKPAFRLSSCSRWPERAGCGQQCLSEIEASPDGCLVRNILVKWYAGKRC